jgi:hypothetical protein
MSQRSLGLLEGEFLSPMMAGDAAACSDCAWGVGRRVKPHVQCTASAQKAVYAIGEVPSDLSHPSFAWLTGDPCDMYPSCCNIDNEEYVVANQPEAPQHLDREEVSALSRKGAGLLPSIHRACFGSLVQHLEVAFHLPRRGKGTVSKPSQFGR